MDSRTLLHESVAQVYASMYDAGAERGWMELVCDRAGAEHAILADACNSGLVIHPSRIDDSMVPLAFQLSSATMADPSLARIPSRTAIRLSDHLPLAELMRTEFFESLVKPLHGGYALTFAWASGSRRTAIAICRDAKRGRDFSDAECADLQPLLQHIHAAMGIRQDLLALKTVLGQAHAALDAVHEAVFIVDRGRHVRHMNSRARWLLDEGGIRVTGGVLWPDGNEAGSRLDALITSVLAVTVRQQGSPAITCVPPPAGTPVLVPRRQPLGPLLLSVVPVPAVADSREGSDSDVVLVLVRDPGHVPACSLRALVTLFGLTPREAELAASLCGGMRLPGAAMRLGITEGTARQYLKQVFAKTGATRQSELVTLMRNIG